MVPLPLDRTSANLSAIHTAVVHPAALDAATLEQWQRALDEQPGGTSAFLTPDWAQLVARVRSATRVALHVGRTGEFAVLAFEPTGGGDAVPIGGTLSDEQGLLTTGATALADVVRAAGLVRWRFDHLREHGLRSLEHVVVTGRSPSPVVDLGIEPRTSSLTAKARRWRRQLVDAHGPLRFEPTVRGPERRVVVDQLIEWKSAQYLATGAVDLFAARWVRDLIDSLAEHGAEPGTRPAFAERTSALWAGDRLVAVHLGLSSRTRWHYWLPAYDPELAAQSPGMLLLLDLIDAARTGGFDRVELGKGDEPYKQRVATSVPEVLTGAVVVPGAVAAARRATWRLTRRGGPR